MQAIEAHYGVVLLVRFATTFGVPCTHHSWKTHALHGLQNLVSSKFVLAVPIHGKLRQVSYFSDSYEDRVLVWDGQTVTDECSVLEFTGEVPRLYTL